MIARISTHKDGAKIANILMRSLWMELVCVVSWETNSVTIVVHVNISRENKKESWKVCSRPQRRAAPSRAAQPSRASRAAPEPPASRHPSRPAQAPSPKPKRPFAKAPASPRLKARARAARVRGALRVARWGGLCGHPPASDPPAL